jgi:hypothetical protein
LRDNFIALKIRILIILFLFGMLIKPLIAQNRVTQEERVLMYESISLQSNLHSVFSQLSIHNEKNIRRLKQVLAFRQVVEEQTKSVKINWDNVTLSGDVLFRDFNFDTLMMPDFVTVSLQWFDNEMGQLKKQNYKTSFPGKFHLFNPDNYQGEEVSVKLQFELSNIKYKRFVNATTIANHYYGYYAVLEYVKNSDACKEGVGQLLDYIETQRALHNIYQLSIVEFLRLKQNDPVKLISLINKTKRLEIRKRTLAKQQLTEGVKGFNPARIFAKRLVSLSVNYLNEKTQYQPYISASYEQMALLVDDDKSFQNYNKICDKLDEISVDVTAQAVFDEFIAQAHNYEQSEAFAYSLLMLDNARLWANRMPKVNFDSSLLTQLSQTIDGMMASYLRVASAGFKVGNREMGNRYLTEAEDLYKSEAALYSGISYENLPRFKEAFFQVTEAEIDLSHFQIALDLLYKFKDLCYCLDDNNRLFTLYAEAYSGLMDQYISSSQIALSNGYMDETYYRMQVITDFKDEQSQYFKEWKKRSEKLEVVAGKLVSYYTQQGRDFMQMNKNKEAMDSFARALEMQNGFLNEPDEVLLELINQNAVPVLLSKIEEAELLIWANRIGEAGELYDEIVEEQAFYHQESNPVIVDKVIGLKQKMNKRHCVDARYKLSDYTQIIQNRVNSGKWKEVADNMQKAERLVYTNKICNLDTALYFELKQKYGIAANYSAGYSRIRSRLLAYGFDDVWKEYADLDLFYQKNNLSEFGVDAPGFYQVVENQQNSEKSIVVIRYYLEQENSLQAFRYLFLLKDADVAGIEVNQLQAEVGRKMAVQISEEQFERIVNTNDRWLQPLIKTYRSFK